MVKITINGQKIETQENNTILQAAASAGIRIPTLCYLKDVNEIGACRVCAVEVEGYAKLVTACNNQVQEGMVIYTNSPKAMEARRTNVELLLSSMTATVRSVSAAATVRCSGWQTIWEFWSFRLKKKCRKETGTGSSRCREMPRNASSACAVCRSVTRYRISTSGMWRIQVRARRWTCPETGKFPRQTVLCADSV